MSGEKTRGQKRPRKSVDDQGMPLSHRKIVGKEVQFKWGKRFQNCPHPLLIPDVLENVFRHLELSQLRNARLACKAWSEETLKYIPKHGKVCLATFEDLRLYMTLHENDQDKNKCTWFKLGRDLNLQNSIVQRFFTKFGAHIEYLHLDYTHWIPASLRKLLYEKLPILEEFILCSDRLSDNIQFLTQNSRSPITEQKFIPNIKILRVFAKFETLNSAFLLDLLSVMPNLAIATGYPPKCEGISAAPELSKQEFIRYEQFDSRTDRSFDTPTPERTLSKLMSTNPYLLRYQMKGIKNLTLVFDLEVCNLFRQANLPLESLEVSIPSQVFTAWHPRPSQLSNFIVSYSKTLKELKLNYTPSKLKIFCSFDSINRLKCLRHLSLSRVSGSIDFLPSLPQLKSLYMTQEDFIEHYDEFHRDESIPIKGLESLKLYYTNWSASSVFAELPKPAKILNVVENICQRFPNLKSLRIESLTDRCLSVVFKELNKLEELEVTNGAFTAAGVTGIPVVNQTFNEDETKGEPTVCSLEKLRKLRLESNKMTDFAIKHSVINMPLEELTLLCYKLSDDSLVNIVRKMGLSVFKTEFCYEFTPNAIEWATKIMKERGNKVLVNPFCGIMDMESVHEFLNDNGPIHISVPDYSEDLTYPYNRH